MDELQTVAALSAQEQICDYGDNKYHVVIMHEKLCSTSEDRYLINIGMAIKNSGHKVTILTSYMKRDSCLDEVDPIYGSLDVIFSAWWIPRSILGKLRSLISFYKALWMSFRLLCFPPKPKPTVIIVDTNTVALFVLGLLSKYKLFYVEHFSILKDTDVYTNLVRYTPTLYKAWFMKYSDEIIVQTECLVDIFRRSYPNVHSDFKIVFPCVDVGLWEEECINIKRIIPDLPKNSNLFVVFGKYRKRSNFRLALEAFDLTVSKLNEETRMVTHIVFAGQCNTLEETLFYNDLIELVKEKPYASQITFLRQLPIVHKKTLISQSTAIVHPAKYDVFPGPITAAMRLGKPIIATNTGLASLILSHRISGILIDPTPQKFAAAMLKIMMKPTLQMFIGDMAKDTFRLHYSFDSLSRKMNSSVMKHSQNGQALPLTTKLPIVN